MEAISIFDIFKVGVGPSSSHTLGPWNAALKFIENIDQEEIEKIQVHLYGSLSKTGIGHATDKAVLLGILGYHPQTIDISQIERLINQVVEEKQIQIKSKNIPFDFQKDVIFESFEHELHPNTLMFKAYSKDALVKHQVFASVGGGFIESKDAVDTTAKARVLPFPIQKGIDIINYTTQQQCSISDIVHQNELAIQTEAEIDAGIDFTLECYSRFYF